ncbi:winged helix-turn-helix domain-containing protein [Burkholderia ubonensis]|uniref:winged helix-turn-helix domain-containing protein n=1 Tax=Burkholderia ubonensis TaxID=101571 RepID=UPI0009B5297A|nr:winged helix-turn-helix domain-containing protein [Burkholderia ubonensis]
MKGELQMVEGKMGFASRRILECVQANPGITGPQVAKKLGIYEGSVKQTTATLVKRGYLARGKRAANGWPLTWTGRPFPTTAEWRPNAKRERQIEADMLRRKTESAAIAVVLPAIRAMVDVGRSVA